MRVKKWREKKWREKKCDLEMSKLKDQASY
jgi:hypothetical protein